MYRLPGLSKKAAVLVVELAEREFPGWNRGVGRPRSLTIVQALRLTLCRLRRNATYNDLSEDFGVGATTAWDYHQSIVAFLADVLATTDADLPALLTGRVFLIDGTLVPTFNWRHRNDLLSGKHRRHGINLQLLVDVHGRITAVSRAFPGSWHDIHCLREAGWVDCSTSSAQPWVTLDTKANQAPSTHPSRRSPKPTSRPTSDSSTPHSPGSASQSNGE